MKSKLVMALGYRLYPIRNSLSAVTDVFKLTNDQRYEENFLPG